MFRTPTFSVALMLFVLGLFGLLLLQGQSLVKAARESVDLIVEMTEDASTTDGQQLIAFLEQQTFVRPGSVAYRSRQDAVLEMEEELGEEFRLLQLDNPFRDLITFNVRQEYLDPDALAIIRNELRARRAVNDVFYQDDVITTVVNNLESVGWVTFALGVVLLVVVVFLIFQSTRATLARDRFLVKNMELVGADFGFIVRPYLVRAAVSGFVSGAIATALLTGFLFWLHGQFADATGLLSFATVVALFGFLLLLGIGVAAATTYVTLNRYVQLRTEELY